MMLDSSTFTPFPALDPSSSFAFYPYTVSPNSRTNAAIRGFAPAQHSAHGPEEHAGPGPTTEDIQREKFARARAERRALIGRRPPGVALGREAEELSDEEAALEDEKQNINLFGHRFLLPFGRRLTQMEMDAAPSPSPSEPDQERRQEDRDAGSPAPLLAQPPQEIADDGDGEEVDLDASIEDMDASMDEDPEAEQEDNEEEHIEE